jgi:hypothetical protein
VFGFGDWYTIGVAAGTGTGIGVFLGGMLAGTRLGRAVALLLAAVGGALVGLAIDNLDELAGGAVGGIAGALGGLLFATGALRRGGTRGGTATLFAAGGVVIAALAFVPIVGYLEPLVALLGARRTRRRAGERYAGLRILARDR